MRLILCLEKNANSIKYITTVNAVAFVNAYIDSSNLVEWYFQKYAKCDVTTHKLKIKTVEATAMRAILFLIFESFRCAEHIPSQIRTCLFVFNGFIFKCNFYVRVFVIFLNCMRVHWFEFYSWIWKTTSHFNFINKTEANISGGNRMINRPKVRSL